MTTNSIEFLPSAFVVTARGINVREGVSWEEFENGCRAISRLANVASESMPYWIGDMIIAGERLFPNKYEQALELTDYCIGTLRNYVWICRNVPEKNRGIMSIPHVAAVARLQPEDQGEALGRAKKEGLSPNELRRMLAGDESYKRRALPEDGSTKKQRLLAAWERIWREKEHEWAACKTSKEMCRKVYEHAVELTMVSK